MGKTTYTVQGDVAAKLSALALLLRGSDLSIGTEFGQATSVTSVQPAPSFDPNNE